MHHRTTKKSAILPKQVQIKNIRSASTSIRPASDSGIDNEHSKTISIKDLEDELKQIGGRKSGGKLALKGLKRKNTTEDALELITNDDNFETMGYLISNKTPKFDDQIKFTEEIYKNIKPDSKRTDMEKTRKSKFIKKSKFKN